ncbi:MAG: zinc-ribbon domain-containing protein, partial [Myxococcota bacterium]|nr:zinc-ribbon domain-containing protein [Myxococcota bacterium]
MSGHQCTSCGAALPASANFCPQCGARHVAPPVSESDVGEQTESASDASAESESIATVMMSAEDVLS